MATATGAWIITSNINAGFIDLARRRSKEITEDDLLAFNQRKHQYTFDVDDNGLDVNGFILYRNKHEGKRHKFRVYLDSNENGRFDKNDELIGRSGLKQKLAAKGVGNLLDEDEIGQLEVRFKKLKSNTSMREPDDIDAQMFGGSGRHGGGAGNVSIANLSFNDPDGSQIVSVTPQLGAEAAWGQLH